MRLFKYTFFLLGILSFGSAEACSYAPYVFSGIDDYSEYSTYRLKKFKEPTTRVAIIKTKKVKKISPDQGKMMWTQHDAPKTLYKMRLQVVEVLKGSFTDEETIIVPKMFASDKEELNARLNRKPDFSYWDGFQMSVQLSSWYGGLTSCGPSPDDVLDNKQHYVIAQNGTSIFVAEPVSGPEDPFVQEIRNLVLENENSPIKVSAEYFFKSMDGYKVFDVTACPPKEDGFEDVPFQYRMAQFGPTEFDQFDHIQGVVEETSNNTKLKPQNFLYRQECNIGDRYIVLEKPFLKMPYRGWNGPILDDPIHRYSKITNGTINVDDIPTNYEFTGEKTISVEQVKTWIREGRAAAEAGQSK